MWWRSNSKKIHRMSVEQEAELGRDIVQKRRRRAHGKEGEGACEERLDEIFKLSFKSSLKGKG